MRGQTTVAIFTVIINIHYHFLIIIIIVMVIMIMIMIMIIMIIIIIMRWVRPMRQGPSCSSISNGHKHSYNPALVSCIPYTLTILQICILFYSYKHPVLHTCISAH